MIASLTFFFLISLFRIIFAIDYFEILACKITSRLRGYEGPLDAENDRRVVVIADIHGCYDGLVEILYEAKIIKSRDSCEWKYQNASVLLIQTGDVVDRGPNTLESWKCLGHLQDTAPKGSLMMRLLG